MGYNFFNVKKIKDSFKVKLEQFLKSLGPAIANGEDITFADNDVTYALKLQHERIKDKGLEIKYETYERDKTPDTVLVGQNWTDAHYESSVCFKRIGVRRTVTKDGKKLYKDDRKTVSYQTLTDVRTGTHPDDESYCCPSCGSVAKISELVNGCPYCGIRYKMDDLFPKVTSYYFLDDVGITGSEGKKGMAPFLIAMPLLLNISYFIFNADELSRGSGVGKFILIFATIFGLSLLGLFTGYVFFSMTLLARLIATGINESSKMGTAGSRSRFEKRMKALSPEFSFEYFTSKAISLIKTTIYSKDEQDLLFYTGKPVDPAFKDIIDLNYGGALGIAGFDEKDGITTVWADAFFDALYAGEEKVKFKRQCFRAVFQRRTDIPVNLNFSMTRIQCPSCASSFDATKNKICPSCGHAYEILSDDWVLVDLKLKK